MRDNPMTASSPRSSPSSVLLETQARADLAAGRWRKAREAFKDLSKRDRAAFQPLLVEANVGLARAMLEKDLISDAREVLPYLRTIASPRTITALEAEIAAREARSARGASDPVALLADGTLAPDDQRRVADQLVAAFENRSMTAASPARAQVMADLQAIQKAVEAICLGDQERALEYVRPLKRDSAFAHWRLFVRAVAAFQHGDANKAAQYFGELPADSVPGRARSAWLIALGKQVDTGRGPVSEAVLEAAGTLAGESGWGRTLARAEVMWRAGKHVASYRTVRDAKESFPASGADFSSILSDFYFNSLFGLSGDSRDVYADALSEIETGRRAKSPAEQMLIRRTLALLLAAAGVQDVEAPTLRGIWEAFLLGHQRIHGTNPRLASAGFCWLGATLTQSQEATRFLRPGEKHASTGVAIAALAKSIELDPSNTQAHILLASVYASGAHTQDRKRLLDLMAARFPDHKEVLFAVGAGFLERKAYSKAITCYERALAADQLDPATPDLLVTACLLLAAQSYQKGALRPARQALARADALVIDSAENFVRGRWCLAARRGVLEMMYGDADAGTAAFEDALARSPSRAAGLLFARLAWSFYAGRALRRPFPPHIKRDLAKEATRAPNGADAKALLQLWRYWGADGRFPVRAMDEQVWLRRYLKGATRALMSRDDAARVCELLRALPEFGHEAATVATQALKRDPADPLFRLYRDCFQPVPHLSQAEYELILAEARRRGDLAAERLAQELSSELKYGPRIVLQRGDDGPGEFEDDDYNDAIWGSLNSPDSAALSERLANATPNEIATLRKQRPKGVSPQLFDLLLFLARADKVAPGILMPKPHPPPSTPRIVKPRPEKSQPADPDQPDLF